MTRRKRILIELLAPPPLGALLVFLPIMMVGVIENGTGPMNLLPFGLLAVLMTYILGAIPTIIYTVVMEMRFASGLSPASWRMVGESTLLGWLAGCAVSMPFWIGGGKIYGLGLGAIGVRGAAVGFLIGTLIRGESIVRAKAKPGRIGRAMAIAGLFAWPLLFGTVTRHESPWVMMWTISAAELYALKLLTLVGRWRTAPASRVAAYLFLWPGLNAEEFLRPSPAATLAATGGELAWAATKLGFGLAMFYWAAEHTAHAMAAWAGMVGIILALHFGVFQILSWCWRKAGVDARPIMRAPILAVSVAEFWGARWNVAFAETARRHLLRPLARRWGVLWAGAFVFLVSGLVHETVISLPARGGRGGPTLYFLLQATGVGFEKSPAGRRLGLGTGLRGRAWMLLVTAAPLPLLLPPVFNTRVILPLLQGTAKILP